MIRSHRQSSPACMPRGSRMPWPAKVRCQDAAEEDKDEDEDEDEDEEKDEEKEKEKDKDKDKG